MNNLLCSVKSQLLKQILFNPALRQPSSLSE